MSGKRCKSETYEGYFKEWGASIGPLSGGIDYGYNKNDYFLPTTQSGVNEGGPGLGFGAQLKLSWCYYVPMGEW